MDDSQSVTQAPEFSAAMDDVELAGDEEIDETLGSRFADFLRTCWSKRRMFFGIIAAGILVSVLYAFFLPNVYTSSTTLMPPDNTSPYAAIMSALSPSSSVTELSSTALGINTPGDLFISILESRDVQDGMIKRFDLARYYKTRLAEDTRRSLMGDTSIVEDRKSGIITISVKAANPVLAAELAQGYVDELSRVVNDNTTFAARRERIFLEGRVSEVKDKLDDTARDLSQFSTKSGAIDVPSQTRSMVDEGLKLQAELIDGRSQLAALRETYSADNVKVRALEAHNAELQRELDKMSGVAQGSAANPDANNSPYPTAEELPTLGLTYFDLERKMRVQEALWEALTRQYEAAKVEEAEEIPSVRVLDVANVPERKSGPSRRLIVEIGAILSFVLACAIVLTEMIWEGMDPEGETMRLVTDAGGVVLDSRRWYWKLPGMKWVRGRLTRSNEHGSPNAKVE
jgi:uncharacterized protein involved in exopolysaccharide biosynthesis